METGSERLPCLPALAALPDQIVLDGELVVCVHGRVDFTALQRRLHPAARHVDRLSVAIPACYLVFDLLAHAGRDRRVDPYWARRERLVQLMSDAHLPLAITPMTSDRSAALQWLTSYSEAGIEGVVAKRLDQPYREGKRSWRKIRTRTDS